MVGSESVIVVIVSKQSEEWVIPTDEGETVDVVELQTADQLFVVLTVHRDPETPVERAWSSVDESSPPRKSVRVAIAELEQVSHHVLGVDAVDVDVVFLLFLEEKLGVFVIQIPIRRLARDTKIEEETNTLNTCRRTIDAFTTMEELLTGSEMGFGSVQSLSTGVVAYGRGQVGGLWRKSDI